MKIIIPILTLLTVFVFLSCSGSEDTKTYKQWLKDYETFIDDEYIPLMKRILAGDATAADDMQSYTDKVTKLSEQAVKIQLDLSGSDLAEFTAAYSRIAQKISQLQ